MLKLSKSGVQSVTRVVIKEQGEIETKLVINSGSADENYAVGAESFQKSSVAKFSFLKWMVVRMMLLICLFYD